MENQTALVLVFYKTLPRMRTSAAWELAAEVVQVSDLAFPPAEIIMRVGDTVEWGNEDFIGRAATASVETGMSSLPGLIRILSMRPSECRNIMKGNHKLDRLRLRGLSGAKDEVLLTAMAQNPRRLAKLIWRPPQSIANALVA